ncbi:MAG: cobalamin-dependent protein [Opitutales bacterium]|nr:cobalamin-dependent protein [Opitutales bacterium]
MKGVNRVMRKNRNEIFPSIISAIIEGDSSLVIKLIEESKKINISTKEILDTALLPAIRLIAEKFQGPDFYVPNVLLATYSIKAALITLQTHPSDTLTTSKSPSAKTVIVGTVEGDIHDIGKNLVCIFLQLDGFKVIDLGVDVKPNQFAEALNKYKPSLVGMSSLLTTTAGEVATAISFLKKNNLLQTTKIMAGGGAITKAFALSAGADGYAPDAFSAVQLAKSLICMENTLF